MRSDDAGTAAVEFALVMPFLLLLISGMIDFGRAYHAQVTLSHAAREGARELAISGDADAAKVATQNAAAGVWNPDAPTMLSVDSTGCTDGTESGDAIVDANFTFDFITPLEGLMDIVPGGVADLPDNIVIRGRGVMRCGG